MATCIPFQTQLSSIMEVLVKAAVTEISKLVDDKCALLHLEISRKQSENEILKRKLLMMENKNAQLLRGFGKMFNCLIYSLNWWRVNNVIQRVMSLGTTVTGLCVITFIYAHYWYKIDTFSPFRYFFSLCQKTTRTEELMWGGVPQEMLRSVFVTQTWAYTTRPNPTRGPPNPHIS